MSDIRKLIFLDIDGVLNGHHVYDWSETPKPLIHRECMIELNKIILATGARCVLSSSWRYMVHAGSMTVRGFSNMLRTHGFRGEIIDVTVRDGDSFQDRHLQISAWLSGREGVGKYVVLDDDEDAEGSHPFIKTDGRTGLTPQDTERAIEMLGLREVEQ
jgi:hypothetical protein